MTRLPRLVAALAASLLTAVILGVPLSASAQPAPVPAIVPSDTQDFSFTSYDADYYLARDTENHSTLRTVETFVAKFPNFDQNRGIIRAIPNDYDGVPLHTTVVSVTDAGGAAVPYEASDNDGFTELALGTDDYVHGSQTYVISYTQQNVVRAFADTGDDELYWDTNGTGFEQPFGRVTARVHIDPALAQFLTGNNACYRGVEGSTDTCTISQDADATATAPAGVSFTAAAGKLGPGENVSVAIGFTAGTFVQVPAETKQDQGETGQDQGDITALFANTPLWSSLVAGILALLGLAGLIVAIVRRAFFGPQDSKGRGIIVPQYSPPKGINLLQAASLIQRPASGLPAQLVSFAVRGNVRILDYPVAENGGDYTLQLVTADGVDEQEKQLLEVLFGTALEVGALRAIGGTDDELATALERVRSSVGPSIVSRGFRAKASSRGGILVGLALVALLFVEVVFAVLSGFLGALSGWIFLAIPVTFVCMVVAFVVGIRPTVLTDAGAELRDYLEGVRDYLQLAEKDRFEMLQSPEGADRVDVGDTTQVVKLYEKLLPFAVLWNIEDQWAKELAVYYDRGTASPDWYVSNGAFNSLIFAQALVGLSPSVTASATPTPAPTSWSNSGGGSFSGGSFGGGFSGGGGGGGGGGGH